MKNCMDKVTDRYISRSNLNVDNEDQSSAEEQVRFKYDDLKKESEERSREIRQLKGEELQGLTLRELQKLEDRLDSSLNRVYKAKVENCAREISILKQKAKFLMEKNRLLKQTKFLMEKNRLLKQIQLSGNGICMIQRNEHERGQSSDTSLTLGLPLPAGSK